MPTIVQRQAEIQNKLLSALSEADYERLAPHFQTVSLEVGEVLKDADEPACFMPQSPQRLQGRDRLDSGSRGAECL
jgi:hypothetical protein